MAAKRNPINKLNIKMYVNTGYHATTYNADAEILN